MGLFFEEVGAEFLGAFHGLGDFPFFDFGGVAGEEDVGDFPAFVVGGAGVDGGGEEVVLEGV